MSRKTQGELEQAIMAAVPINLIDAEGFSEAGKLMVAKARAKRRINVGYEAEMGVTLSRYPWAETLTFDRQEREARAWQADNAAATPYLDTMLSDGMIDKATLVANIINKADQYVQLSGPATRKRHRLEDQIEAASTVDELDAIKW